MLASVLVLGCSDGQPSPTSLDEALNRAVSGSGLEAAVQLARVPCLDRTCVLIATVDEPAGDVVLFVLDSEAPFGTHATSHESVGSGPGTLAVMETDEVVYVFGRITDPRIRELSLELQIGNATFAVGAPGYVVAYAVRNGFPQGWRFRGVDGLVIAGSNPNRPGSRPLPGR